MCGRERAGVRAGGVKELEHGHYVMPALRGIMNFDCSFNNKTAEIYC